MGKTPQASGSKGIRPHIGTPGTGDPHWEDESPLQLSLKPVGSKLKEL